MGRGIDGQSQEHQLFINLIIINGRFQVGQRRLLGDGLEPLGEAANGRGIIILLDMLSGTGNSHAIQDFKEIKVQHFQKICRGAFLRGPIAPCGKGTLGIAEYFIQAAADVHFSVYNVRMPLIGKGNLIFQVTETVIDGGGRQHQDFGFHASPYYFVQELQIAVFLFVLFACQLTAIAEIVRFINHNQVIVAPVQTVEVKAVGIATGAVQVSMEKNVVTQTVCGNGVVYIIIFIGVPVVGQLLGAENQNVLVPILVILNNRQSREGLTETDTISQDAAIELFQLIDDCQGCIFLIVKEQIPNLALLKAGSLIGQHIFRDVFQELVENVVKGKEVDEVGAVFVVGSGNGVYDFLRYFLHTGRIIPEGFKQRKIGQREGSISFLNHGVGVVATLTAQINGSKTSDRHIVLVIHIDEAHHILICHIGLEHSLFPNPVRTLLCNGFLGQLIAQFDLKFSSI